MKKFIVLIMICFFLLGLFIYIFFNGYNKNYNCDIENSEESVYSEPIRVKRIFLTEKSGELTDGFTYEINDEVHTITLKGEGIISKPNSGLVTSVEWKNLDKEHKYKLILEDGITEFDFHSDLLQYVYSIYFGKDISSIYFLSGNYGFDYEISPENPYFSVYNGCIYSKDFKKLFLYPERKEPNDFHPDLTEIGDYAFENYMFNGDDTLIIPWGVTKIGNSVFNQSKNGYYVIPDTAVNLDMVTYEDIRLLRDDLNTFPYWIPSRNNIVAWEKWHSDLVKRKNWGPHPRTGESAFGKEWMGKYEKAKITDIASDNIAKYYDIKPNSFKTFQNGKTYYFDGDYKMAVGWTEIDGNRYYFGEDGAMYKDCKTPDGYYVNTNGVWVK